MNKILNFSLLIQVKEHLDFFLNEAKISADDIPKGLNIFGANPDEMRTRLGELSIIGAPIKIHYLCGSAPAYFKYAKRFSDEQNEQDQKILLNIEKRLRSSQRKTFYD